MWFDLARAKSGRDAIGTLSRRGAAVLTVYIVDLAAEPVGAAPIFRNRSGAPYSKDTLGDDFRAVRSNIFGTEETRQLADFRRSGGRFGRRFAWQARGEDGQHFVGVEPAAQNLLACAAGASA